MSGFRHTCDTCGAVHDYLGKSLCPECETELTNFTQRYAYSTDSLDSNTIDDMLDSCADIDYLLDIDEIDSQFMPY